MECKHYSAHARRKLENTRGRAMGVIGIVLFSLRAGAGIVCLLLAVSSYRAGEIWSVRCEREMDAQFIESEKEENET